MSRNENYKNSPITGDAQWLTDNEEDKRQSISRALMEVNYWGKREIVKSDKEAEERIEEYYEHCMNAGVRPTVEGLALAMGTTRATLFDWETGRRATISADVIKKAKERIAQFDALMVAEGKLNPVTYIFRSKNYYGMRDQTEHILTPNQNTVDKDELLKEAEMLPE